MPENLIKVYLDEIEMALKSGNATEHTYRPALKTLLESLADGITATNEPKRVECGAPDYVISLDTPHGPVTIGYVEAKDVGSTLNDAERSAQLKRYRASLPNLILTDYLEFKWYWNGEIRGSARLARESTDGKLIAEKGGKENAAGLLRNFLSQPPEEIQSPRDLAMRMARLTHMIRDIIVEAFDKQLASELLKDLRKAFASALIPDLDLPDKTAEFADMYAQTMAYGLFAARCNHQGPQKFQRLGAANEIPKTNPFLRKLFTLITGPELEEEPYAGFADDLTDLLARADIEAILTDFGKRKTGQDPTIHFYETFLSSYDPKLRETRGVYYTPDPVVSFIVQSVDHILKTQFDLAKGLADTSPIEYKYVDENGKEQKASAPQVLILDPACGTGTFLYAVVDLIRQTLMEQGQAGMWSGYVKNHLLPRLFGFELLMAPYAVAHFKLGMQLAGQDLDGKIRETWKYDFQSEDRLGIYMTNTLETAERIAQREFKFIERIIAEEARQAARIKKDLPILVVLGNPPYEAASMNKGKWIVDLVRNHYYPQDDIKEHNPKLLLDDYVKFIRWAQWRIEQTGAGILAFISNHGYLDNPTFRRMRCQLSKTFSEIYLLDLHGNAKKKEKCPDGSKDENVFDIQQGVSIGIFVKRPKKKGTTAKIYHSELWGKRQHKYANLLDNNVKTTEWKRLDPQPPFYLFVPRDIKLLPEYETGWKITDIFPVYSTGIKTHRDHFAFAFDRKTLEKRISEFKNLSIEDYIIRQKYDLPDTRDWKLHEKRLALYKVKNWRQNILKCLYRPFDKREIYYHSDITEWPRPEVLRHILTAKNIGLITTRQTRDKWDSLVTSTLCGHKCCAGYDINSVFPLYLYPDPEKNGDLFSNGTSKHVNISSSFIAALKKRLSLSFVPEGRGNLKKTFGPEDIFNYIYAVFHSPSFRSRYAEFLKSDFPRVPLTSSRPLFAGLCKLGGELVSLHLMESRKIEHFITNFPVPGSNEIEKGCPKYVEPGEPEPWTGKPLKKGRVYINPDVIKENKKGQYFEGVPSEIWEFHVGGYQVCHRWLKDRQRQGRKLEYEDIEHYHKIIAALSETIRIMTEIDQVIDEHCGWPLPGSE